MAAGTGPAVTCRCGHPVDAHRHYRRGSDCALCDCPAYHRPAGASLARQAIRRLRAAFGRRR